MSSTVTIIAHSEAMIPLLESADLASELQNRNKYGRFVDIMHLLCQKIIASVPSFSSFSSYPLDKASS